MPQFGAQYAVAREALNRNSLGVGHGGFTQVDNTQWDVGVEQRISRWLHSMLDRRVLLTRSLRIAMRDKDHDLVPQNHAPDM